MTDRVWLLIAKKRRVRRECVEEILDDEYPIGIPDQIRRAAEKRARASSDSWR